MVTLDQLTLLVPLLTSAVGALAGYWGRIATKVEDRRDDIYLETLPTIYSSTKLFVESFKHFLDGGPLKEFVDKSESMIESFRKEVFSANILLFKEELHMELEDFYDAAEKVRTALQETQRIVDKDRSAEQQRIFRLTTERNELFPYGDGLTLNPNDVREIGLKVESNIMQELKRYRSYSWRLTWLVVGVALVTGLAEVIKTLF